MTSHQARKRFGQHFLHDQQVIDRIVATLAPMPGQAIVEIGPGLGALTLPLLRRVTELQVIELDRDVVPHLQAICSGEGRLLVHSADALSFDYRSLVRPGQKLRLVGNLPYNISTPLLFHLLTYADCVEDMLFMLQREVVDRMTASPGTKAYGRLSASIAVHAEVEALFNVGPGAFKPPPKVESAVVRLVPRPAPFPLEDQQCYGRVISMAFSQRRKTLANALRELFTREQLLELGIDPQLRAERITPAQFALLANQLSSRTC